MLLLTRLNNHPVALNGDLIKSVESSPDTTITLVTGEKIVVLETLPRVLEIARAYRAHLLNDALTFTSQDADAAGNAQHAASANSAASAANAHNAAQRKS
jgi:flagellar protein FlbD